MTERELFEKCYEENNDFMINKQFLMEGDRYLDRHVRMAWIAWQASANRQGYKLVPVDVLERCIYHIGIASCHPANSLHDDQQMESDIDELEKSMICAVGN